jgi:hypothetical protein
MPQKCEKKLIKLGWDAPSPLFFKNHISEMEKRPFDGILVQLFRDTNWWNSEVFITEAIGHDNFLPYKDAIASVSSSRLASNSFIILHSGTLEGTTWNWIYNDHWNKAKENLHELCEVANAGGFAGIFFDPEVYKGMSICNTNSYPPQEVDDLVNYAFLRGQQFMQNLQNNNLRLISTFLFTGCLYWGCQHLGDTYYLFASFINGILSALDDCSVIEDGNEPSYSYKIADELIMEMNQAKSN